MVEDLLTMYQAQGSIPSTQNKKLDSQLPYPLYTSTLSLLTAHEETDTFALEMVKDRPVLADTRYR